MSSWPERLETAIGMWRQGDLDGATAVLREVVVSGDTTVIPEASQLLGRVLQDSGDLDGARAAHRSVIASGHPMFAQRSAISLALMLVDDEQWALAYRPLRIAAAGADADLAVMADVALVRVLGKLGDLDGAAEALTRARRSDHPGVAELTEGMEDARWPEDGGERERQAWEAFEAIVGLLDLEEDDDGANDEIILTGLNKMLAHGLPELCSQAAFRLYSIYADRAEFEDCRRVMEHAIAVGDPAERGLAEKLLGAVLFDLGEHVEARDAYRRAAEDHRPEIRLDALIQESKFTRELGDEEGARAILWRVVESGHPRFALEARACLGQVYSEAGEVDEAVGCWRVVLGSDSEFHQGAVACLGMLLHGLPGDDPRRAEIVALLRQAAELDDSDVAFQAQMTLTYAENAVRGPDEELEQAVDDCDAALELIRADDLAQARTLLRRVIDAEIPGQSARACAMLATLEYGEGDLEQAHELLEHMADVDDYANGFAAAVNLHLIAAGGVPHPVLNATVGYQRLGREAGIAAYQECAGHSDPAVSALAKSTLAQVYVSLGVPRSQGVELLDEAADAGDPLALSHAAVISFLIRDGDEGEAVVDLLRRAHEHGHPALAPWVAQALGTALERQDLKGQDEADEALAAYTAVREHPGLGAEAEARILHILETRRDLPGVAAVHERIVARGDRLRAARSAWLLGFTRVRMDDLDAARRAFDQVGEDDPELAQDGVFARGLLGHDFAGASAVLAALGEQDDAARSFMNTWLALEAAHAWQRAGDAASADAALSLAVACGHPERVQEAALFLGALRNDAGDHAGAAEAWAVAADGDDEHHALLGAKNLGEALAALGDLNGAATAYRRALDALDPDDDDYVQVVDVLTRVLVAACQVTEARDLQVMVTGDGPHAHLAIGAALEEAGELDAAVAEYRQAIDGEPGTAPGTATNSALGTETESVLGTGPDSSGPDSEVAAMASVMLARVLDRRGGAGDAEGARVAYERAATADDPYIRITAKERLGTASPHERALLRLHDDDRAGALELFTQAYGSPVVAELHIVLSEGELTAIRPLLERAANGEARHAEKTADLVLGVALDKLRAGANGARELYELVVEFGTPEQVAIACDNFGHVYDLAGDTDAAAEVLALGAAVDHPAALSCLRRLLGVLALQGDVEALEGAARRAVASGDPETVTLGTWTLSDVAKARGDLAGAVAGYRDTIDGADPDTVPYIRVELGRALHQLGDTAAAHRELETVLTCDNIGQVLLAGVHLGAWLAEDGRLAGAAEAFGAAAAAGLRHPAPEELDQEHHAMALNNLAAVAYQADEAGDHTVAVRALHLAAAGGAFDDAVELAKEYASAAAERGDLDAVRTYHQGAAAFLPDGDPHLLLELAELLTERGSSADPEVREPQPPQAETTPAAGLPRSAEEDEEDEEDGRRRAELFAILESHGDQAGPSTLDSLLRLMRDRSGTPTAGAAGRQVIRAARESVADDPAQARAMLELVLEYGDPEEVATAYDDLGDISCYHDDDMDAAITAYRKGSEVDHPAALIPLRSLMLAQLQVKDFDGVAATAQRAVTSGDTETVAAGYWMWGDSRRHRGDTDAAVRLYRQAIGMQSEELGPRVRLDLARTLRERGEGEEARAELGRAAEAGDTDVRAQAGNLLGKWAFEDGDLAAAAEALGRVAAIEVGPDDPDLLSELVEMAADNVIVVANRAFTEGDHQVAVRALALAAQAGEAQEALKVAGRRATELAEAGDRAGAVLYIESAVGFLPDPDPDLEIQLADLYAAAGEPAEARARYERLIDHPDAHVRLVAGGRLVPLLRVAGDAAGLADVTQRMTDDSAETGLDTGAQALLASMLGMMQSEQGDSEAALRTLRAAAESGEPTSLFTLGQALVDAGEIEEARTVLGRVAESDSRLSRRALVMLGHTYQDEDAGRARELYLRVVGSTGEADGTATVIAKMYLGALAKRERDWPEALRWYQQVIDSGEEKQAPLAAAHLGELAYWLGDRSSAVRYYELTLATDTRQPDLVGEAAYRLGEIRHGDGDLDLARKHLRRAVESGDEDFAAQAQTLLAKLGEES
ncbi:tetratricopeptide repeat protein [Nonomuraea sp. CA-143628]|uniref:tetratricopeptide repeat protein n=1 Tax=Nonomuraea sp. CA-143628 TaxID=3239997 RepID=UPI003D8D3535